MSAATDAGPAGGSLGEFLGAPLRVRVFITVVTAAALSLPFVLADLGPSRSTHPEWMTASVLVLISILNVEISRVLSGGLAHTQQPHKALSAWAFACALLLPTPWLLVVVPLTYAHARWRGLRVPLWKWVGSAGFLVLAGLAVAVVRDLLLGEVFNWMLGDGGRGIVVMLVAAAAFLVVESLLFAGIAWLNDAEDEAWLRRTLRGRSFYLTEGGVLLVAGLLAAVWTGGSWYVLFLVPIYALAQRAALHEPLRERAEAAAQLRAQNDELELNDRFRIDLMGMLGHEIGNPLTSILGYAQVGSEALEEGDDATARKSLLVVERNAGQIRRVVHDILALVRSDTGALTAHPDNCVLEPFLEGAAQAQPPGLQPTVECDPDLMVSVQSGHLDQILFNLLNNAAKYAGGATRLSAAVVDGWVRITVADEGPGVPEAFRDHLFERFSRDTDSAHTVVGTGLGLFICRQLAIANGGEITHLEGQPRGSVFVVTLPMAQ